MGFKLNFKFEANVSQGNLTKAMWDMLGKKSFIYKAFVVSLICIFFLSTSCVAYRNMRPTGEYTVLNKEKLLDVYTFRAVQLPKLEKPLLVIQLGKYPVFREHRKVEEVGERKNYARLVGFTVMFVGGLAMAAVINNADSVRPKDGLLEIAKIVGISGGIIGFWGAWANLGVKAEPVSRFSLQDTEVKSEKSFEPIANARIKASSPTIAEEWILSTDSQGKVFLDMSQIARLVRDGGDLAITFQTMDANKITNTFTIPQSFFADLKTYYASIRPPQLVTTTSFDDVGSWKANRMIDGAEEAHLIVAIENRGEGKALDVKLRMKCDNPNIKIDELISLGQISPGSKVEQRVPITAQMELADGLASFEIQAMEQRGYHAGKVELKIPVRKLDKPVLQIVSVDINDGHIGLAKGNANGIPENGETVELITYVQNQGVGPAIGSKLNLVSVSSGINVISGEVNLGRIEASATEKTKFVLEIPRKFSQSSLEYKLVATDVRNACPPAEESGYYAISQAIPILAYEFKAPAGLKNGSSSSMIVTPKNIGKLTANGIRLSVTTVEEGIKLANNNILIGSLAPSTDYNPQIISVQIPRTFTKKSFIVEIKLSQDEFTAFIENREIPLTIIQPELSLLDRSSLDQQLMQGTIGAQLTVAVANEGNLMAEDVTITAATDIEMIKLNNTTASIGSIPPKSISENKTFILDVPGGVASGSLPIHLRISQKDFPTVNETLTYRILERSTEHVVVQPTEDFQPRSSTKSSIQAPIIMVPNIQNNEEILSNRLSFTAFVSDNSGLASVKASLNDAIFYNSQTDEGAKAGGKALIIQKELTAFRPGQNIIKIVAVNNSNIPQEQIITVNYTASVHIRKGDWYTKVSEKVANWINSSKNVAVVIGIDNYMNPKIRDLQYADNDAIAIKDFLKQHTNFEIYAELINEKATKDNILGVLDNLKRDDSIRRVVFYFSGHGRTEKSGTGGEDLGYFQPVDFDPERPLTTGIPMSQVRDWAQALPAKHVLFIFDACFSGIVGGSARTDKDYNLDFLAENVGRHVITAGTKDDQALEYNNLGHGVLTYYLLEGLQGGADVDRDDVITLNELAVYLKREVTNFTQGKQHPQLIKFFDGNGELFVELIK